VSFFLLNHGTGDASEVIYSLNKVGFIRANLKKEEVKDV